LAKISAIDSTNRTQYQAIIRASPILMTKGTLLHSLCARSIIRDYENDDSILFEKDSEEV
jgi:hypothetical protein